MIFNLVSQNKAKIILISAISAVAGVTNIWLMALINKNVQASDVGGGAVIEFALVLTSMVLISLLSQILLSRLSARAFFDLRERLVRGITRLTFQQIETISNHRLYTALTKDVPAVHELFIVLPNYVFNFTLAATCLVYLATVSIPLFGIFLAFLVVALGVSKFAIADRAEKKFQLRRKIEDDLFRCYEAVIDGNKELKLNTAREAAFLSRDLREHAEKYRRATLAAEVLWNMSANWSSAMIFIGIGALLFLSPLVGVVDRAAVTSFILVIFFMVAPLTVLMNSFRTIYNARVSLARLTELQLNFPTAESERAVPRDGDRFETLSMKGVSFSYESKDDGREGFQVGPFDLELARGEIVYFVGGNGSGKTTAAKLVTGLYETRSGSILLNGQQVIDPVAYFQTFSAIFQDYYLFDTLVAKNGRAPSPEEVRALLDRLRLSAKIEIEDGRISTTKLSYGQRKRLALLVAYFDDSDIYVFDEWAADQDPEFREFFYRDFLFDLKRLGKTVVVVSHDDRYFHLADKVVKFEGGKIVSMTRNDTGSGIHSVDSKRAARVVMPLIEEAAPVRG